MFFRVERQQPPALKLKWQMSFSSPSPALEHIEENRRGSAVDHLIQPLSVRLKHRQVVDFAQVAGVSNTDRRSTPHGFRIGFLSA
jgi:hypothetical protein